MSKKGRVTGAPYRPADKLPAISSDIPRDLRQFVERVRDTLTGMGDSQLVTTGDLKQLKLVDGQLRPVNTAPDNYLPPPAAVTGLTAEGVFQNVIINWTKPVYNGHAYTELWGSPIYDTSIPPGDPNYVDPATLNDLNLASPVAITTGASYVDRIGGSRGRFYWARNINIEDREGPFNSVSGTNAETVIDIDYIIGELQGQISESELATALTSRIDTIENTGSDNTAAIQTEAATRATETGELYAQYTVKIDVNGYVAGFGLASTPVDGGGQASEFAVLADRFYIASPSLGVSNAPFIVQATPTTINGVVVPAGVYMTDAYIRNGSIVNAKIGNLAVDNAKIASLDAAKITTGFLDADRLEAGSVTTDKLTVRGGQSNLTPNGTPFGLFIDGWTGTLTGFTVVKQNAGSTYNAVATAPTEYIYRIDEAGAHEGTLISDVYVRPNEQFHLSFDHAGGGIGGGGIYQEFKLAIEWGNSANTTIATTVVEALSYVAGQNWRTRTAEAAAPNGATKIKRIYVRRETGASGYGFLTNIEVKRRLGDVLIADGAITAGKIAINGSFVDIAPNGTPTSYAFDGWEEVDGNNPVLISNYLDTYDDTTIRPVVSIHIAVRTADATKPAAELNAPTPYVYRFTDGSSFVEGRILKNVRVRAGDKLDVRFLAAGGGSTINQTYRILFRWADATGSVISASSVDGTRTSSVWVEYFGQVVAPAGAALIKEVRVQRLAGGTGVFGYITDLQIRRMTGGVLIEDGAVTADKISAAAVNADKLTADAIYGKRSIVTSGNTSVVTDPGAVLLPSDIIFWAGDKNIAAASRTRENGLFWIDTAGSYSSPVNRTLNNSGFNTSATTSITHKTVKGGADLVMNADIFSGVINNVQTVNNNEGTLIARVKQGTTTLASITVPVDITGSPPGIVEASTREPFSLTATVDNTADPYYTSKTYFVEFTLSVNITYTQPTTPSMSANGDFRATEIRTL